jgi:hypothetical protein
LQLLFGAESRGLVRESDRISKWGQISGGASFCALLVALRRFFFGFQHHGYLGSFA